MKKFTLNEENLIQFKTYPTIINMKNSDLGKFYYCSEGKFGYDIEDLIDNKTEFYYLFMDPIHAAISCSYFIEYDEALNMLCIIFVTLSVINIKENEKRDWEETFRFYIDKEKNMYVPEYETANLGYNTIIYHRINNVFERKKDGKLLTYLSETCINENIQCGENSINYAAENLLRIFPHYYTYEVNEIKNITNKGLRTFLLYDEPKKEDTKNQKDLDYLSSFDLPVVGGITSDFIWKKKRPVYDCFDREAFLHYIPKINTSVLRCFFRSCDDDSMIETLRLYILEDRHIFAIRNNFDEWIVLNDIYQYEGLFDYPLVFVDDESYKNMKLSYHKDFISTISDMYKSSAIFNLIQFPIFEKLYKAGYENVVRYCIINANRESDAIRELFFMTGLINDVSATIQLTVEGFEILIVPESFSSTLYGIFGLNKFQFKVIFDDLEELCKKDLEITENSGHFKKYHRHRHILRTIKSIVSIGEFDEVYEYWSPVPNDEFVSIAHIDNDTFMKLYSFAESIFGQIINYPEVTVEVCRLINTYYGFNAMINSFDYVLRLAIRKKTIDSASISNLLFMLDVENGYDNIVTFRDYLEMVADLELTDRYGINFKSAREMLNMHEEVEIIYETLKTEIDQEKFEKRTELWKKWEYEDKDYKVIAPTNPRELTIEGSRLHHCVKSYIAKVTNGKTNILFVRKQSEPDVPFFTVEISNTGKVEQIHGFANRNLDTEPDLIPFIRDWINKKGLEEHEFNKVR